MLSLHVITVGRAKESWVADQFDHYRKLLAKYARIDVSTIGEEKYGKGADIAKALAREAVAIRARLRGGYIVALDSRGSMFTTEDLSIWFVKRQVSGTSSIEFLIGGPYGLDEDLKGRSNMLLSLSPLTMSHQIVRLVLLEQLYRVFNLAGGGRYHK